MICAKCGQPPKLHKDGKPLPTRKDGTLKLPRGWKRGNGQAYCEDCWHEKYVVRAITLPVVCALEMPWPEFRTALTRAWSHSTGLSNWTVRELLKADCVRTPEMTKLPPAPKVYLYPGAREAFPAMDTGSLVCVLHAVEQKYRKKRFACVWLSQERPPYQNYPVPYPVRGVDYTLAWTEDNRPTINLRLAGQRLTLLLRSGAEFRRQLTAFGEILKGNAIQVEAAIYRQNVHTGDHRSGATERDPAGGKRQMTRVMCKIVAWLPRKVRDPGSGVVVVRTINDGLLEATFEGRTWRLNCDHIRRSISAHRRMLDRVAEDQKAERRKPKRERRFPGGHRVLRVIKHRNRLDSVCNEASANLVNWALRQRAASIEYDDSCRSFVHEFPWHKLKTLIAQKADFNKLGFSCVSSASDELAQQDQEVLETETP